MPVSFVRESLLQERVGNVPGYRYDNTYCPQYSTLLIERRGFEVTYNGLNHGQCLWCQRAIVGVWQ